MALPAKTGLTVLVVTGASGGIGAEVVRQAAATRAFALVVSARRRPELLAVARECLALMGLDRDGASDAALEDPAATELPVLISVGDGATKEGTAALAAATLARFGKVDVLLNNVGAGCFTTPSELTVETLDSMMRLNVHSALLCTQAFLPTFLAQKGGTVVNVTSILGRGAMPGTCRRSAYIAAKHAVYGLTAAFKDETAQACPGLKWSVFSPGPVDTEFGSNAGGPSSSDIPGVQGVAECAAVCLADCVRAAKPEVFSSAKARSLALAALEPALAEASAPSTGV